MTFKSKKNHLAQKDTEEKTMQPLIRIQKLLSEHGYGSRRALEQLIKDKKITVNGVIAQLGMKITGKEQIQIDRKKVVIKLSANQYRRVIAYHKEVGEICTRDDPEGRNIVFKKLPKLKGERWISIGRLDINTSGLLLFTNDGELAKRLMHPSYKIERGYAVRIFGKVTPEMTKQLVQGVELEDGKASFTDIVDSGGEGVNHWFHVCLSEGRNREVRRLWESQGVRVNRLMRVRFGSFMLPLNLRKGLCYTLTEKEVNELCKLVSIESKPVAQPLPQESSNQKRLQSKRKIINKHKKTNK